MRNHNNKRFVGIVGDGGTDREILAHTARVCLGTSCEAVVLERQSLRDGIDEYWKTKKDNNDGVAEREVTKTVIGVLAGALVDFESRIPRPLKASDFLILSTDAERHFTSHMNFFDPWAWQLISAGYLGMMRFTEGLVRNGRSLDLIPCLTLFIPFPSTEVLIAAVRAEREIRGIHARELKARIYNTKNLSELQDDDFNELALMHITPEGLTRAFRFVPEARNVLGALGACFTCPCLG